MVKHPQSKLGYMVDGCQLWVPSPQTHTRTRTDLDGVHKQKYTLSHKKKKKVYHSPGNCSIRAVCKSLRFHPLMEDLKNSSKQGLAFSASYLCHKLTKMCFNLDPSDAASFFFCMARCLVVPDAENRSALYYASHSGHASLAQQYLALLVLARTIRQPQRTNSAISANKRMTIREWFDFLGYIHFFGPPEMNLCVLNALNDAVKAKYNHQKYTLIELRNIAIKSTWRNYIPQTVEARLRAKTKTAKPRLNTKLDLYDELNDTECDTSFSSDHDESDNNDEFSQRDDSLACCDDDDEITMQLYHLSLNIEFNNDANAAAFEEGVSSYNGDDHDSIGLHLEESSSWTDVVSDTLDADSFVDVAVFTNGGFDNCCVANDDDWSVVSKRSTGSEFRASDRCKSYSNALRFGKPEADPRAFSAMKCIEEDGAVSDTSRKVKNSKRIDEECCSDLNQEDAQDYFYNLCVAQKDGRGGKKEFMFKGNQRNARMYRSRKYEYYFHKRIGKPQSLY